MKMFPNLVIRLKLRPIETSFYTGSHRDTMLQFVPKIHYGAIFAVSLCPEGLEETNLKNNKLIELGAGMNTKFRYATEL